jgi:CubicO group peptidase (beta-lactamase class C family)
VTVAPGLRDARQVFARRLEALGIVAGAGAVVADGSVETVFHGRLRADGQTAVGPDSTFHICSCSKAFTALAFATLVSRGLVGWDDPVRGVLPEFVLSDPWVAERCTFRDLAGMRLGLSRQGIAEWGFRAEAPPLLRLSRMETMAFESPFRDRFSYSNLAYIALATAIARIAGAPFEACLADMVFVPLGLGHAACAPGPSSPSPHMRRGGAAMPVEETTGENSLGSARVHLSAQDAGAWLAALLALALREDDPAISELFRPQSIVRPQDPHHEGLPRAWAYAMGWMLSDLDGHAVLTHGGGGRGWRAFAVLDPARSAAAMVMTADEGDTVEDLALGLLDLASGEAPGDRLAALARRREGSAAADLWLQEKGAPAPPRARLAGIYANAVTGEVRVTEAPGGLSFEPTDAPLFAATLVERSDGPFGFSFDNPAMSAMPGDPAFTARFIDDGDGGVRMRTTYFGDLRRIGP